MLFSNTHFLNPEEKQVVFKLWNQEYPKSLSYSKIDEFDNYLAGLKNSNHVLVKDERNNILGWYSDFKRDDELWFAMILDTSIHEKGIGTRLIERAKKSNKILNGWAIDHAKYLKRDGSIYKSPLKFYLKNNFEILQDTRLELPNLSAVKIRWTQK